MSSVRRLQKEGYLYGRPSAALNLDPNKGRDGRTFPGAAASQKVCFFRTEKGKKNSLCFSAKQSESLEKNFYSV